MKSNMDKYFLELTDKLAFLQIEESTLKGFGKVPSDFAIPIFVTDIKNQATGADGFSTEQIASAILYLLGIDPDFKFHREYREFLKNAVDRPESFASELAIQKYELKSYKDAMVYFRAAMVLKEDEIFPFFNYGQIAMEFSLNTNDKDLEKDLVQEAAYSFEKVLHLDEKEPLANFQLGLILREKGELQKALSHLQKAVEYGDGEIREKAQLLVCDIDMYERLVNAEEKIAEGQYEAALAELEGQKTDGLILELRYQVLFAKGFCHKALGNFEEAINIYSDALAIHNQDTLLLAELGVCYAYLGEYEQSLEFYLAALELEKDSVGLLNNIAILYLNLNNIAKAKEYIGYAKELASDDEIVDATILRIRKAEEGER